LAVPPAVAVPEYFGTLNEDILFLVDGYHQSLEQCNSGLELMRSSLGNDKEAR